MRRNVIWGAAVAALGLAAAGSVASEPAKADPIPIGIDCDRACLQDTVDQVLAAMVAHDAHRLPLSADFRYTENGQQLAVTDGFWGTATAKGAYEHTFLDPRTEQAAVFATMKENGTNTDIIAMRVKMEGRKISEIEAVFSRTGLGTAGPNGASTLEAMGRPDAVWTNDNPDHASREDIIRTSNKYFTALENDDGKGDYSFFADDCWRFENGIQTTSGPHPAPPRAAPPPAAPPAGGAAPPPARQGPSPMSLSCKGGFQTGTLQVVTRIRDRRFPVVDEEKGVAFSFGFFDHNAQQHDFTLADGSHMHGGLQAPFTWEIAEAFRIEHGQIKVVEAVINNVPYGMKAGWNGH